MSSPHETNSSPLTPNIIALQKTISELQALNRLAQKIIEAPNVEAALDEVVAETLRLTSADGGSLMLVNPVQPNLEATHSNQLLTLARRTTDKTDDKWRQVSRNIAGWILKNNSPLLSENLANDERFAGLALLGDVNYGAVGVPIHAAENIVGALIVFKTGMFGNLAEVAGLTQKIAAQVAPTLMKLQQLQSLAEENRYYKQTVMAEHGFPGIIGKSKAMQNLFGLLQRITPSDVRVLIEGESGTGKELIARTLHYNGPRREKKFLAIDCGAIPENLLESELFGYMKGAFTGATQNRKGLFQEADAGTLFLDEINNLPLPLQAKLMRVLQEGEVRPLGSNTAQKIDVRIIAASSRSLGELVKEKSFREDLYFRLKVVTIKLPSLRERLSDIPLLADHFLKKYAKQYNKPLVALAPAAVHALQRYPWPGNIRELEHAIEQAVVLAPPEGTVLAADDLPEEVRQVAGSPLAAIDQMTNLPAAVETLEMRMIRKALEESHGNKSQAAEKLGLSRRGLLNKLKRYKIEPGNKL
ncbi:MAG: sigma-54-dependent Fis family transcriptional regulator [candidate division KSB1 bacterium]|nr:sigma-54-dependent Fis family transcriptional regulator [candidate division KSB1 bacterium]MDZ7304036.1 sigma-54-dependent Fis family transcriptional regulator [candidate division KSB1 bacterium]MDZ7313253.1 sigma-54-dependent Fis family transcriptional regulator [candidate division KSB1 bacterium]